MSMFEGRANWVAAYARLRSDGSSPAIKPRHSLGSNNRPDFKIPGRPIGADLRHLKGAISFNQLSNCS
ncbi:hypothetical protein DPMN_009460 [Dreissena polymorpha]|uniref:Uncharacterized protein n=1 Tax=Dreissena polymorpha TaxID=45954 RepID=A0A9D4RY36_DREPO|nr:hypothetical protein DPMN_009460 [Dreissena polymorpha]